MRRGTSAGAVEAGDVSGMPINITVTARIPWRCTVCRADRPRGCSSSWAQHAAACWQHRAARAAAARAGAAGRVGAGAAAAGCLPGGAGRHRAGARARPRRQQGACAAGAAEPAHRQLSDRAGRCSAPAASWAARFGGWRGGGLARPAGARRCSTRGAACGSVAGGAAGSGAGDRGSPGYCTGCAGASRVLRHGAAAAVHVALADLHCVRDLRRMALCSAPEYEAPLT